MPACAALLRAVNVGGRGKVAMADVRALAESLGLTEVRTLLQSGNLVFVAAHAGGLEARLENAFADRLGLKTDVLLRTADEWSGLIAGNSFATAAADYPGHLVAVLLTGKPAAAAVAALEKANRGHERIEAGDRAIYIHYVDGIGRSKLTNPLIEKHLGLRGTGRNWNTVLKIAAALEAASK